MTILELRLVGHHHVEGLKLLMMGVEDGGAC